MWPCRCQRPYFSLTHRCILFSSLYGEDVAQIRSLCVKKRLERREIGEGEEGCSKYTTKRVLAFLGRVSEWRKRFLSRWIALVFSFALDFPRLFLPTISCSKTVSFVVSSRKNWPAGLHSILFSLPAAIEGFYEFEKKGSSDSKISLFSLCLFDREHFISCIRWSRNNEDDTRNEITARI